VSTTTERRELAIVVIVTAAAAGLVLYAASRSWSVDLVARPAPLPPATAARSGSSLVPALPALALVALAAAGALLATRGRGRFLVGLLIAGTGLGVVVASLVALAQAAGAGVAWAWACVLGGAVMAAVGGVVLRRGQAWPSLGTRYDRAVTRELGRDGEVADRRAQPLGDTEVWDAIDRGEDPTA
jgi:hypothetical protein